MTAPGASVPPASTLRARILSALVLGPIALLCVALGGIVFAVFAAAAVCIMAYEWTSLSQPRDRAAIAGVTGAALSAAILCTALGWNQLAGAVPLAAAAALWPMARLRGFRARWAVLGLVYCGVPSVALIWLRGTPQGLQLVVWILLLVWAVDIGAYIAGRRFGGPRLAPRISPAKTWSGLAGGAVAGGLVAGLAGWALDLGAPSLLIPFGMLLAVWEQVGDLAESAFKRHWRAKDSGHLIPGHGGVLDRVDGLLAVAPVVALVVWWRLGHGLAGVL